MDFDIFWKLGPWERVGRKAAERHFKASVKTERDWHDIQDARSAYVEHLARNKWKRPQHGSTWFNNWRDWLTEIEQKDELSNLLAKCKYCFQPTADRNTGICDDCYRQAYLEARQKRLTAV